MIKNRPTKLPIKAVGCIIITSTGCDHSASLDLTLLVQKSKAYNFVTLTILRADRAHVKKGFPIQAQLGEIYNREKLLTSGVDCFMLSRRRLPPLLCHISVA